MCDEYDEDRMRALWRQLAIREERTRLEPETDPVGESPERPLGEIVEPKPTKPRALLH